MPWISIFVGTIVVLGYLAGRISYQENTKAGWVIGFLVGVIGHPVLVFVSVSQNPYQKGGPLEGTLPVEIATGLVSYFATVIYLRLRNM